MEYSKKMYSINFSDLFPTKSSALIFILYMSLFVSQGILVTRSQNSSSAYEYNTVVAVLLTEVVKSVFCFTWYCSKTSLISFFHESLKNVRLLWLYFIPAFLYCLYNNLSYINLLHYDPATYFILMQLRVVITGLLFQIIFNKTLNFFQWTSLILLTIGCMTKNVNMGAFFFHETLIETNATISGLQHKHDGMGLNISTGLMLLQVLCSCFAGVYSEYLLKKKGLNVNMFVQNAFLYIDSIICNIVVLCWQWDPNLLSPAAINNVMNPTVLVVIVNNAAGGIVTSFFLKYLNSILKTVASALELVFITILTWLLFGVPITYQTIISICIVSTAIFMYTQNPVKNLPESNSHYKKANTDRVLPH